MAGRARGVQARFNSPTTRPSPTGAGAADNTTVTTTARAPRPARPSRSPRSSYCSAPRSRASLRRCGGSRWPSSNCRAILCGDAAGWLRNFHPLLKPPIFHQGKARLRANAYSIGDTAFRCGGSQPPHAAPSLPLSQPLRLASSDPDLKTSITIPSADPPCPYRPHASRQSPPPLAAAGPPWSSRGPRPTARCDGAASGRRQRRRRVVRLRGSRTCRERHRRIAGRPWPGACPQPHRRSAAAHEPRHTQRSALCLSLSLSLSLCPQTTLPQPTAPQKHAHQAPPVLRTHRRRCLGQAARAIPWSRRTAQTIPRRCTPRHRAQAPHRAHVHL